MASEVVPSRFLKQKGNCISKHRNGSNAIHNYCVIFVSFIRLILLWFNIKSKSQTTSLNRFMQSLVLRVAVTRAIIDVMGSYFIWQAGMKYYQKPLRAQPRGTINKEVTYTCTFVTSVITPRASCLFSIVVEVLLLQSFDQTSTKQREIKGNMQDQTQDKLYNCLFEEALNEGFQCVVW